MPIVNHEQAYTAIAPNVGFGRKAVISDKSPYDRGRRLFKSFMYASTVVLMGDYTSQYVVVRMFGDFRAEELLHGNDL